MARQPSSGGQDAGVSSPEKTMDEVPLADVDLTTRRGVRTVRVQADQVTLTVSVSWWLIALIAAAFALAACL